MELLLKSIQMDWAVLLPIFICSLLVVAVAINRISFYKKNKVDVKPFIEVLRKELRRNNLEGAQTESVRTGGIIGELAEKGVKIFAEQRSGFSRAFDIQASLATRELESHLTILATIGGVAPFLGLFGTVVRILLTFNILADAGNQAATVASGIGSALIATAFGLGVAIVAVILYNSFQSIVKRFEDDFQLIKFLFLSFVDSDEDIMIDSNSAVKLN